MKALLLAAALAAMPVPPTQVRYVVDKGDVTFDHAAHLPRVNGDCKRCHAQQPEAGATSYQWPAMAACTSCHNHQKDFAESRCRPCHVDLDLVVIAVVAGIARLELLPFAFSLCSVGFLYGLFDRRLQRFERC